jgi:selenocysteine-specific elongation factor
LKTLKNAPLEDVLNIYVADSKLQPITSKTLSGMIAITEDDIRQGLMQLIQQKKIINTTSQGIAVIHANYYQQITAQLVAVIDEFHTQFPLKSGMAKEELRKKLPAELPLQVFQQILDEQGRAGILCMKQQLVWKRTHRLQLNPEQTHVKQTLENLYRSHRYQPPNRKDALKNPDCPEHVSQEIFHLLVDEGTLIRVDDEIYYHKDVLKEIRQHVISYLEQHHEISIGDVKDLFQISRKYSVPIMTYLDATGITIRKGDIRVLRSQE